MHKEYKTVLKEASAEYIEKKSKFIANIKPVSEEETALSFLNSLRSKYWDASHNVYAYSIMGTSLIQRYSDDGEPSGTAGMPVLEAIKRLELQNVVVVVTRYFGGTLLGASGLVRAYGKSAVLGLEAAGIIRRIPCRSAAVIVEYSLFGKVQNYLMAQKYIIKNIVYEQDVEIQLYIQSDRLEGFEAEISEVTNAKALVEYGEFSYITVNMNGSILDGV